MSITFFNTQNIVENLLEEYSLEEQSQFHLDIKSATKIRRNNWGQSKMNNWGQSNNWGH